MKAEKAKSEITIQEAIEAWYKSNGRDLPWRRTKDPYKILVSEIMLQQTQVSRVVPKYMQFVKEFPSFPLLAEAPVAEVIRIWSGMGYNNRAVRLHKLAGIVAYELKGVLPSTVEELKKLPGIGEYTAAAVACFAFGSTHPILDTNIYRVLSRIFHGTNPPSKQVLHVLAGELAPKAASASSWSQALMDIGATICNIRRPQCISCPAMKYCHAAPKLQDGSSQMLAVDSAPPIPKQSKFHGSPRYFRGRIIDILINAGENGVSEEELIRSLENNDFDINGLITGLESDGLVKRVPGRITLP